MAYDPVWRLASSGEVSVLAAGSTLTRRRAANSRFLFRHTGASRKACSQAWPPLPRRIEPNAQEEPQPAAFPLREFVGRSGAEAKVWRLFERPRTTPRNQSID